MKYPYPISKLYRFHSKKHVPEPIDPNLWPNEYKTTFYKSYPRLKKIELPVIEPPLHDLFDAIKNRASRREFGITRPLTKKEISILLKYSCGTNRYDEGYFLALGRERRFRVAPSAAARFPIEIYPIVLCDGPEIKSGVYHYDILHHQLAVLCERSFSEEDIMKEFSIYEWIKQASMIVIMTAVFERSQDKYGERGYQYILIEAGHIGQNIYLTSGGLQLKCGTFSGKNEEIEKLLDIDGNFEAYIHSFAIGI